MAKFDVDVGDVTYEVDAPDEKTAWKWAKATHIKNTSEAFNPYKMVMNAIPSLYNNTVGGLYDAVTNPLQTATGVIDMAAGGLQNITPKPLQDVINKANVGSPFLDPAAAQRSQNMANLVGQDIATTYGTGAGFKKTMEEDPFRVVGDASMLLGGAGAVANTAKLGKLGNALSKASAITNPMNALIKPATAVISPTISPQIQSLMKEGVTPTAGQILGGGYKRAEEALTSVPVLGDFIKSAQNRAMQDVNRVAINRALTPIGEKLPDGVAGREAIQFVSEKLDDAYGNLLPKMTVLQDEPFKANISDLKNLVQSGAIDPKAVNFFNNWIDKNVVNKFQGQGAVTGQTLKQVQSDLRETISRLAVSTDAD